MKESFNFLLKVESNTYLEHYGIDFEDFEIGQVFEHRPGRTFTEADCLQHGIRSLDLTPATVDRHYAQAVYGERSFVMESYALSAMASTTKTFGKVVANLSMTDFEIEPIAIGDTLYFESKILEKRESRSRPDQGLLQIETRAHNQHRQWVLSFQRKLLIYRKGLGPYNAAGY